MARRDTAAPPRTPEPLRDWADDRLVAACLDGDERAWAALLNRYKALIYSLPRRNGASAEDAADIFQLVCVELLRALPRLREPDRVRGWVLTIAAHQTSRWQHRRRARDKREGADLAGVEPAPLYEEPDLLEAAEREQRIREAIATLAPRCRELIRLLFYRDPPLPYRQLAQQLGLASGSIGFIRGRCLRWLKQALDEKDVRW